MRCKVCGGSSSAFSEVGAVGDSGGGRRLRADARRNHEQLLAAARDVVVELGAGAPLDEGAPGAGVGIGTLYRRFPSRPALLRAVVVDALQRTAEAAEAALAEESDGFSALVRYMHAVLDLRVSAVIPTVLDAMDLEDDDVRSAREVSAGLAQRIVDGLMPTGPSPRTSPSATSAPCWSDSAAPCPARFRPTSTSSWP